jgi:hypothetical protein
MLFIGHENLPLATLHTACYLNMLSRLIEDAIEYKKIIGVPDTQCILIMKSAFGKGQKIDRIKQVRLAAPVLAHQAVHVFPEGEGFLLITFKVCKVELF